MTSTAVTSSINMVDSRWITICFMYLPSSDGKVLDCDDIKRDKLQRIVTDIQKFVSERKFEINNQHLYLN